MNAMNVDPVTCSPVLSMPSSMPDASGRPYDPVRARVSGGHSFTHAQASRRGTGNHAEVQAGNRSLHLLADNRPAASRRPHPVDVLYWVACLGGACLLLFTATT